MLACFDAPESYTERKKLSCTVENQYDLSSLWFVAVDCIGKRRGGNDLDREACELREDEITRSECIFHSL